MKKVTSLQNPFVKSVFSLKEKVKSRKKNSAFLIEGKKEILLAIRGGYKVQKILFYPKICSIDSVKRWAEFAELIEINKQIFQKLSYRSNTGGVIAIAETKDLSLRALTLSPNPLILIVEKPEKPGNIGALLRTADAANLDAVIIANPGTDLYNPNVVRSSVGCLFTTQIAIGSSTEVISFLKDHKIAIYSAVLKDSAFYHLQDYTFPAAIVIGAESTGLTQEWKESSDKNIVIPMQGSVDSMNLSVSAAILIFEAKRQRGF